jgi:hypothetical protein
LLLLLLLLADVLRCDVGKPLCAGDHALGGVSTV